MKFTTLCLSLSVLLASSLSVMAAPISSEHTGNAGLPYCNPGLDPNNKEGPPCKQPLKRDIATLPWCSPYPQPGVIGGPPLCKQPLKRRTATLPWCNPGLDPNNKNGPPCKQPE